MLQFGAVASGYAGGFSHDGAAKVLAPGPRVSKPELRQDVQRGGFRSAIHGCDSTDPGLGGSFGVPDAEAEITVLGQSTGVEQFEYRLAASATPAPFKQGFVWRCGL